MLKVFLLAVFCFTSCSKHKLWVCFVLTWPVFYSSFPSIFMLSVAAVPVVTYWMVEKVGKALTQKVLFCRMSCVSMFTANNFKIFLQPINFATVFFCLGRLLLSHSRDFPLHLSWNDRAVPGDTHSSPLLGAFTGFSWRIWPWYAMSFWAK